MLNLMVKMNIDFLTLNMLNEINREFRLKKVLEALDTREIIYVYQPKVK